jgi:hypothetical protein
VAQRPCGHRRSSTIQRLIIEFDALPPNTHFCLQFAQQESEMKLFLNFSSTLFGVFAVLGSLATPAAAGEIKGLGNKCLDVRGGAPIDSASVQIFSCHGGENQKWKLTETGEIR